MRSSGRIQARSDRFLLRDRPPREPARNVHRVERLPEVRRRIGVTGEQDSVGLQQGRGSKTESSPGLDVEIDEDVSTQDHVTTSSRDRKRIREDVRLHEPDHRVDLGIHSPTRAFGLESRPPRRWEFVPDRHRGKKSGPRDLDRRSTSIHRDDLDPVTRHAGVGQHRGDRERFLTARTSETRHSERALAGTRREAAISKELERGRISVDPTLGNGDLLGEEAALGLHRDESILIRARRESECGSTTIDPAADPGLSEKVGFQTGEGRDAS